MKAYIDSVVQAFPTDHEGQMHGMTLRDYFAAAAMQGICASGPTKDFTDLTIAREAYALADAMIKARS